ncbi:MAG TPA: M28 family peptidase, partial [Chitinophagaceae bacterium]|nr:M28 family peptidase [Chitinophagaceae bacterium]
MRTIFQLLFVGLCYSGLAQKGGSPQSFAKLISPNDLKTHLYIIAGAEMEGRETATPGQRKAAAYIENQFKKTGLTAGNNGSYQMQFNVYQDSITSAALEVNGQAFSIDKDFNPALSNIAATLRFSEVVYIGGTSTDSLNRMNLAGKLVMVTGNTPASNRGRPVGAFNSFLQAKGVAGILSISSSYPRTPAASRKGNQALYHFSSILLPQQTFISEAVARAIIGAEYESLKGNNSVVKTIASNVLLDVKKTTITEQSSNVIGVLPGTDLKDEYLFITAHYDHLGKRGDSVIYYGADDDGSGTVAIMELADAFAQAKSKGKGPRRTIVFMAVSGEEKGLWGSEHYSNHPLFALDKTTADLNIDMIGRSDTSRKGDTVNYVYVVGDDKLSTDLKKIS